MICPINVLKLANLRRLPRVGRRCERLHTAMCWCTGETERCPWAGSHVSHTGWKWTSHAPLCCYYLRMKTDVKFNPFEMFLLRQHYKPRQRRTAWIRRTDGLTAEQLCYTPPESGSDVQDKRSCNLVWCDECLTWGSTPAACIGSGEGSGGRWFQRGSH